MNLNCENIDNWLPSYSKPLLIAGPCSAESEEQVLKTAKELAVNQKPDLLRAGIWKPRTRPYSFEGVGDEGLEWLVNGGKAINVPTITEVANAKHVQSILQAGVDMVWIGARTTVNPFLVQEIADALEGTDIPVLVKNPINPDITLWIGALERFQKAGLNKLAAIHRGFSSYDNSVYRNIPMWEIPIELKAECPEISIICDPSHIAGTRNLLGQICQRALDLGFAGLMIESHINPDLALSDKDQQVTPERLKAIITGLQVRKEESTDEKYLSKLEHLRNKIDEVDAALLKKLAQRLDLIKEIGQYKKQNNVAVLQIDRWKSILETRLEWSSHLEIEEDWMKELLAFIHSESIRIQTELMRED